MTPFEEEALHSDHLMLTPDRCKAFAGFWDRIGSETASEEFENKLAEASSDLEDVQGNSRIKVADNERLSWARGRPSGH